MVQCNKEEAPAIGSPYSQVKGIQDTWSLTKIEMSDDIADPETLLDVSDVMLGDTVSLLKFSATEYELTPGNCVHYIPLKGSWRFDNDQYPTQIILNDSTDHILLDHLHPVREVVDNTLRYRYHRIGDACAGSYAGKSVVSYIYTYTRI